MTCLSNSMACLIQILYDVTLDTDGERAITLEREPPKKKQRTDIKKDAKRIKSDNFTRSKKEESNIAIAILGN